MDISVLQYFLDVCEEKNISHVAEKRYISRQAVSQAILKLEQECGTTLLTRRRNGIELTRAGEMLYEHVKIILSQWQEAMKEIHGTQPTTQILRVGYGQMAYTLWPSDHTDVFRQKNPNLALEMQVGLPDELFLLLDKGELDMVVTSTPYDASRYSGILLYDNPLKCIVRRADFPALEGKMYPDALQEKTILYLRGNTRFADTFEAFLKEGNITHLSRFTHTHELTGLLSEIAATKDAVYPTSGLYQPFILLPEQLLLTELHGKKGLMPPQKNISAVFLRTKTPREKIRRYVSALKSAIDEKV